MVVGTIGIATKKTKRSQCMNERAASGSRERSDAFQVGDEVMFTQGILEGLTGIVSEYGGSRGLLVMTKDWPTGVRVLVTDHSLQKKKPASKSLRREVISRPLV
jgi:hypothetical protein